MSPHLDPAGSTDDHQTTDADQHPALHLDDRTPPGLVLVFPEHLSGSEHMRGVAEAVRRLRSRMSIRVQRHQEEAQQARAEGDRLRQAMLRGQVLACSDAAASIDEALVEVFDLWAQYNAQVYQEHDQPQPPAEQSRERR